MTLNIIMSIILILALIGTQILTMYKYIGLYKKATTYKAKQYIKTNKINPEIRHIALINSLLLTIVFFNIADAYFISLLIATSAFLIYKIIGSDYDDDKGKAKFLMIIMLLANGYSIFFKEHTTISSESMLPNIKVGDFISISKNKYGVKIPVLDKYIIKGKSPEIGDVIVFKNPANTVEYYVKRVVAGSGDTIEYINKTIFVNGKIFNRIEAVEDYEDSSMLSYIEVDTNGNKYTILNTKERDSVYPNEVILGDFKSECEYYSSSGFKCKVPENSYFVMGDNRDDSLDSRYFGFIHKDKLIGRVN